MKKIIKILIASLFLISFCSISFAQDIYVNNYRVTDLEKELKVENGVTYITLEDLARITSSEIDLDEDNKATIYNNDVEVVFFKDSNKILLDGQKMTIPNKVIVSDEHFMVPVRMLSFVYNMKLEREKDMDSILVNSDKEKINKDNKFDQEKVLPKIKEKVGEDFFNKIVFNYSGEEIIKDDKYLPPGQYFIFTAFRKAYHDDIVNGYFYFNMFTSDLYLYSLKSKDEMPSCEKYFPNFEKGTIREKESGFYPPLVANAKLLEKIKTNDTICKYKFKPASEIDENYREFLEKDRSYYFYKAYQVENDKEVFKFYLSQDKDSLKIRMFLKDNGKVNIVEI